MRKRKDTPVSNDEDPAAKRSRSGKDEAIKMWSVRADRLPQLPREDVADVEVKIPKLMQGRANTWNTYSDDMLDYYKTEEARVHEKRKIYTRDRASKDRLFEEKFVQGDVTVRKIRKMLASMGLVQTKIFRDITDAMIMSNLHWIYGKDYERCLPRLLKEFKQKEFYQLWVVTTMRQAGKTSAVQAGCAVLLLCLARFKFVCMGPARRHSQVIMSGTVDNVRRMGYSKNIVRGGAGEDLHVTPDGVGEPSKSNVANNILRCIPATEKGNIYNKYSLCACVCYCVRLSPLL